MSNPKQLNSPLLGI
ncbi:hypothetical protein Avbf_11147 [Armadillidium vulgare]|nr:hypothetical protein Avbf_11147 [Armadillidium vulgare]